MPSPLLKSPPFETAVRLGWSEINEEDSVELRYTITEDVYSGFLSVFQDRSPIHVDEKLAKKRGFTGRVMHGAILQGFLSHAIGMRFPGEYSLLLSVDLRYAKPSHLGDELCLDLKVVRKVESQKTLLLQATFTNVTRDSVAARGQVQVRIADEPSDTK